MAREQRKLAAIVAADVVGYSRLMGRDEAGTVARLRQVRAERLEPVLARRGGRVVKLTGDGALIEFGSAVEALSAAIEFQQAMTDGEAERPEADRLVFRIGVHLGDVIVDGDDLYGDGVNVATRLEAEAPPGGLVISGDMYNATAGRLKATFKDLGRLALKNIERPVQAYLIGWATSDWPSTLPLVLPNHTPIAAVAHTPPALLSLPDKPSIAVLPFQNMSGDPEQEYFVDGMVEEIITSLSRNRQLFVIARNSSFTYKGRSVDIKQVGRELGVRYVLEGSVRKSGNRVRIAGQLIDASTGGHIWADRFDGALDDIFGLQDQVTSGVVGGISVPLVKAEIDRAGRKIGNLQAYDFCLRSWAAGQRYTAEGSAEALSLSRESIALDPAFAMGHAMVARWVNLRHSFGWVVDRAAETAEAERAALRALDLDSDDSRILAWCGQTIFITLGRLQEGAALLDEAVRLDPNFAQGLTFRGSARIALGEPEKVIEDLERALRLSPLDPSRHYTLTVLARAHTLCGRYDKALPLLADALRLRPNFAAAWAEATVARALAGDLNSARKSLAEYKKLIPNADIPRFRQRTPHLSAAGIEKYVRGLRLAGLTE